LILRICYTGTPEKETKQKKVFIENAHVQVFLKNHSKKYFRLQHLCIVKTKNKILKLKLIIPKLMKKFLYIITLLVVTSLSITSCVKEEVKPSGDKTENVKTAGGIKE
jgi:hypothetical protein